MRGYFITGTDTGVGKTFVTTSLARQLRARGQRVFAFKPIETGCTPVAMDQEALVEAAGGWQTGDLRGCYRFEIPAAPLVAATEPIELSRILATLGKGAAMADFTLVEGAGGWRVPISADLDMAGLAIHCALPVIIVARGGLGTINHSLLTADAVRDSLLRIAAIVLSVQPHEDRAFAEQNRAIIADRVRAPVLLHDQLDVLLPS